MLRIMENLIMNDAAQNLSEVAHPRPETMFDRVERAVVPIMFTVLCMFASVQTVLMYVLYVYDADPTIPAIAKTHVPPTVGDLMQASLMCGALFMMTIFVHVRSVFNGPSRDDGRERG